MSFYDMRGAGGPGGRRLGRLLGFGGWNGSGGRLNAAAASPVEDAAPVSAASSAPASASRPQEGSAAPPLFYGGKGSGAAGTRKRMMQLNMYNAYRAQGPMWQAIDDLIRQSQTDRFSPEERARFLQPRLQAYDQQERAAQAGALRDQMGRGIDESSYGGNVAATIGSQFGAARAGAVNDLYQAEEQRQLQSQALLRDLLMGLQGRSSQQAASVADSITNFRLQQAQLDAMNNPWSMFGSALGGGLSIAGQLGWRPWGTPPKGST